MTDRGASDAIAAVCSAIHLEASAGRDALDQGNRDLAGRHIDVGLDLIASLTQLLPESAEERLRQRAWRRP